MLPGYFFAHDNEKVCKACFSSFAQMLSDSSAGRKKKRETWRCFDHIRGVVLGCQEFLREARNSDGDICFSLWKVLEK